MSDLVAALPEMMADPDQLGQVFSNVILNALQAMSEGGTLTITSESPNPEWINVSVTDTGTGISKEDLEQIFNPLFTTKAKGIGLGLSVIKVLVEAHGGTIDVQSTVENGSTFTIKLPVMGGREE